MKRYKYIGWEQYATDSKKLAQQIKKDYPNDKILIVAIGRGGFPVATIISQQLDAPLAAIIVNSYKGDKKGNTIVGELSICTNVYDLAIIVDDLSDTGDTFQQVIAKIHRYFPKVLTAALSIKTGTTFVPDYYLYEEEREVWIVYPYEKEYENGFDLFEN